MYILPVKALTCAEKLAGFYAENLSKIELKLHYFSGENIDHCQKDYETPKITSRPSLNADVFIYVIRYSGRTNYTKKV